MRALWPSIQSELESISSHVYFDLYVLSVFGKPQCCILKLEELLPAFCHMGGVFGKNTYLVDLSSGINSDT